METEESDRYRAPALDKGLDILELLAGVDSGLTQAEFAAHRGVSLPTLKNIEAGKANPTVETLDAIGSVFGLKAGFVRSKPHAI